MGSACPQGKRKGYPIHLLGNCSRTGNAFGIVSVYPVAFADVDREVCPGDIIQFVQAEAFQVFRVGRDSWSFASFSEGCVAAERFVAFEPHDSILPFHIVVPSLTGLFTDVADVVTAFFFA
jgi:hypothetical protein